MTDVYYLTKNVCAMLNLEKKNKLKTQRTGIYVFGIMKRIKLPTCDPESSNCKHPKFHRKHKNIFNSLCQALDCHETLLL